MKKYEFLSIPLAQYIIFIREHLEVIDRDQKNKLKLLVGRSGVFLSHINETPESGESGALVKFLCVSRIQGKARVWKAAEETQEIQYFPPNGYTDTEH